MSDLQIGDHVIWDSPNGEIPAQIDHLFIDRRHQSCAWLWIEGKIGKQLLRKAFVHKLRKAECPSAREQDGEA